MIEKFMFKTEIWKNPLILILLGLISFQALAIETINITQGHTNPIPIAINHFEVDPSVNSKLAADIIKVISADLNRCGLFKPIPSVAFIENIKGINHKPIFASWRQINANLLVNGEIKKHPSGKLEVSFILWDTVLEKDIAGEVFEVPNSIIRRVSHKIADKIYEKMTGDQGYFDTKIIYVAETGVSTKKQKRIAIMDQDSENHRYLTDGKDLVLTPRFSPKADKILYLSYKQKKPKVYLKNLKTGRESLVGDFPGMSFAPRFSPDGTKAILSIAQRGATHLFEINLASKAMTRLTQGRAINTSPSYSPDGRKIVFNSDQDGTRQLYIINSDGSDLHRISSGGTYATPVWSPRGDYIAFTKISRSEGFTIGVMRPSGEDERLIASGYLVEGPSWAPNGRVIAFAKSDRSTKNNPGKTKIYSIDVTGYNERLLPTPLDASDPEWSRNLD